MDHVGYEADAPDSSDFTGYEGKFMVREREREKTQARSNDSVTCHYALPAEEAWAHEICV